MHVVFLRAFVGLVTELSSCCCFGLCCPLSFLCFLVFSFYLILGVRVFQISPLHWFTLFNFIYTPDSIQQMIQ